MYRYVQAMIENMNIQRHLRIWFKSLPQGQWKSTVRFPTIKDYLSY